MALFEYSASLTILITLTLTFLTIISDSTPTCSSPQRQCVVNNNIKQITCASGNCNIDCSGNNACYTYTILCKRDTICNARCNGENACHTATFNATTAQSLSITVSRASNNVLAGSKNYCPNNGQGGSISCNISSYDNVGINQFYYMQVYAVQGWNDVFIYCRRTGGCYSQTLKMYCTPNYSRFCWSMSGPGYLSQCASIAPDKHCNTYMLPTHAPTLIPTLLPTYNPTTSPTTNPTITPTHIPTSIPTLLPTYNPTTTPTYIPSLLPTYSPTTAHITNPTNNHTLSISLTSSLSTSIQNKQTQYVTTNTLNTESEQHNHHTQSFINTAEFIPFVIIVSVVLLCVIVAVFMYKKERSKSRKVQKELSHKTLTQLDLEDVKVMHYIHVEPGTTLEQAQHALPQSPGDVTPGVLTPITPEVLIPDPANNVYESNSSDDDHDNVESNHEFQESVSDFASSNDVLLGADSDKMNRNCKGNDERKNENYQHDTFRNDGKPLYHEKQKWEMCLLHALNSLLQREEYTHKSLDNICKILAPNKMINPHKSILQTGNYDANVLMMALSNININVQWFDARKTHQLDLNDKLFLEPDKSTEFVGFILNNPQKAVFGIFNRRHWLAIKKINGHFYNLDSKLHEPKKYDSTKQLTEFLMNVLTTNNAELMICRRKKK